MAAGLMFRQAFLCEEMGDLWWEPDHQVWRWLDAEVWVSMTRREDAIFCHFSAGKGALRHLKAATEEFVNLAFELMPWCQVIMGSITLSSVAKLMERCGFEHVVTYEYLKVYARYRT